MSFDEGVGESLVDGRLTPRQVPGGPRAVAEYLVGDLEQPLRGIGPAVEDDVLDALQQLRG